MATTAAHQDLIRVIAEEMAYGVETAVDCWMSEIDSALADTRLTPLARLNAVHEIVQNYKLLTGKGLSTSNQLDAVRPKHQDRGNSHERNVCLPHRFERVFPARLGCSVAGRVRFGVSGRFGLAGSLLLIESAGSPTLEACADRITSIRSTCCPKACVPCFLT